jgi:hypothetical protein
MSSKNTMTNDEIARFCEASEPVLIYLAIGSAGSKEQQHPQFLKAIGGPQICILVDPHLEDPPAVYSDLGPAAAAVPLMVIDNVTYIPVRRFFEHHSNAKTTDDILLLHRLCYIAVASQTTRLIVQDYSGKDLRTLYPVDLFGFDLRPKVLFDFTYRDGGCYVDFSKVRLLCRGSHGSFVQPHYESLEAIKPYCTHDQITFQVVERAEFMSVYVKRLYRIQNGEEPDRDWCTSPDALAKIARLCAIYGLPQTTDNGTLEKLLSAFLFDLCAVTGNYMGEEEARDLIRRPERDYESVLLVLKELFTENNLPK